MGSKEFRDLSSEAQNLIVDAAMDNVSGKPVIPPSVRQEIVEWATPSPVELLKLIHDELLITPECDQYDRGYLRGRAFEITKQIGEHPEWWNSEAESYGCCCEECCDA